eukprot:3507832-Rhodomonas_salina.1
MVLRLGQMEERTLERVTALEESVNLKFDVQTRALAIRFHPANSQRNAMQCNAYYALVMARCNVRHNTQQCERMQHTGSETRGSFPHSRSETSPSCNNETAGTDRRQHTCCGMSSAPAVIDAVLLCGADIMNRNHVGCYPDLTSQWCRLLSGA